MPMHMQLLALGGWPAAAAAGDYKQQRPGQPTQNDVPCITTGGDRHID